MPRFVAGALLAALLGPALPASAQGIALIDQEMAAFNARLAQNQDQRRGAAAHARSAGSLDVRPVCRERACRRPAGRKLRDIRVLLHRHRRLYARRNAAAPSRQRGNAHAERAAWNDEQAAESNRGAVQADAQRSFAAHSSEVGNLLRGTSTSTANDGSQTVLPHTWQADTAHQYDGRLYYVDVSGNYGVATGDGRWAPLHR